MRFASGDGYSDKGSEYYDRINSSVGDAVIEHYSKLSGDAPKPKKGKDGKAPARVMGEK